MKLGKLVGRSRRWPSRGRAEHVHRAGAARRAQLDDAGRRRRWSCRQRRRLWRQRLADARTRARTRRRSRCSSSSMAAAGRGAAAGLWLRRQGLCRTRFRGGRARLPARASVRFPVFVEDAAEAVRWTRLHRAFRRRSGAGRAGGAFGGAYNAVTLRSTGVTCGTSASIRRSCAEPWPRRTLRLLSLHQAAIDRRDEPRARSPGDAADQFRARHAPPLWLATGTEDTSVRPRNARNLAAKLKSLGAPVTLREYPGLGHEDLIMAVSKPFRGKGPILAESADFLIASSNPAEEARR